MRLDSRQQAIIDAACELHAMEPNDRDPADAVISIQAIAGAGKSLVVTDLARRLSTANFLFLCKSRNIADRARATLPPSVIIQTFDQAARRFLGITHPEKVSADRPLPANVSDKAMLHVLEGQASPRDIPIVRRTLLHFYRDSARNIDRSHVETAMASLGYHAEDAEARSRITGILPLARQVWGAQTRRSADSAPICQGAALKIWTLGRNTVTTECNETREDKTVSISPLSGADVVVIEEAQDLDAAQIGFIARQNRVTLMFGDDMQSLETYAPFRHQEHTLQRRGRHFTLTRSYRFSGDVPALLTDLRERESGEVPEAAEGMATPQTQMVAYSPEALADWMNNGSPVTVIAPSVIELVTLTLMHPNATVGWVDGLLAPHYHWATLFDLACLAEPPDSVLRGYIQNPHLRQHPDLETACDTLYRRGAGFTSHMADWVLTNRHCGLAHHLQGLRQRDRDYQRQLIEHVDTAPAPALTLTTVRAAKGHEWPTVAVVDSLVGNDPSAPWHCADATSQRQVRWLYTAISRAEHTVMLPQAMLAQFAQHGRDVPIMPADHAIKAMPGGGDHPHFGLSRYRVLEMSSESREARRQHFARHRQQGARRTPSNGSSGHQRTRRAMEEAAKNIAAASPRGHLKELKKLTTIKNNKGR